jgi:hypothetical protein
VPGEGGGLLSEAHVFKAGLGARERLVTYAVGYGVGIGLPILLAVTFAVAFDEPGLLLFPIPFALAFGAPYFFRPTGFAVSRDAIEVLRPIGPRRFPLRDVREGRHPASSPPGPSFGLARVEGIHGNFGTYWSRGWGRYRVYVTNADHAVELRLDDGSRLLVSPDDPPAFVAAVQRATAEAGIPFEVTS